MHKKKVVIIGGGNGCPIAINALKKYHEQLSISAVVTMSDSGGSTGKLRAEFRCLPPSDVMRATLAFSRHDFYQTMRPLFFGNRFTSGKLAGHNLGNIFLTLAAEYAGSFTDALKSLHESVEAVGTALPVTTVPNDLCVRLSNGKVVRTEGAIDKPAYDRRNTIVSAWLESSHAHRNGSDDRPKVKAYGPATEAIIAADYIIIAAGSLFTSVVAALLPTGVAEAIAKSRAKIVYIAGNAYQTKGETGPTKMSEIIETLERYLPRPIDTILYNNHKLTPAQKKNYLAKEWGCFTIDLHNIKNHSIVTADFETKLGGLSPDKLRAPLLKILNGYGNKKRG